MESNRWVKQVGEFQRSFEHPFIPTSDGDWAKLLRLRLDLVHEEHSEFLNGMEHIVRAMQDGDDAALEAAKVETLDAITDSIYVLIGTANALGWDLTGAFEEVHRSNMSKLGVDGLPIYNAAGKVMKGPGFRAPRLEAFVK